MASDVVRPAALFVGFEIAAAVSGFVSITPTGREFGFGVDCEELGAAMAASFAAFACGRMSACSGSLHSAWSC